MAMYYILYFLVNFALITRGVPNGARIVNGYITSIRSHPHMVSIEVDGTHNCGGSLIKPNMVLTAAHCINANGKVSVRTGTPIKQYKGKTAEVLKTCIHPKYVNEEANFNIDYDVAVLKLDRSLPLDNFTNLIELQSKGVDVPDNSVGKVAGWGALQEKIRDKEYPLILQEVKLSKINQEICKVTSFLPITDRVICFTFGIGQKSFCDGDSGSAIVVDGKQVGIVSYSLGCGIPLFFHNLFTRIANEDIRNHIDQCIENFSN